MKQKAQDTYDLWYMRKYKELNRIGNPIAWAAAGVALLGLAILMIGVATATSPPKEDVVYESLDGQEITASMKGNYLTYNETVFIPSETSDIDDTGTDALVYTGVALSVIGLLAVCLYYYAWVPEASKKAGWVAVGQLEEE